MWKKCKKCGKVKTWKVLKNKGKIDQKSKNFFCKKISKNVEKRYCIWYKYN